MKTETAAMLGVTRLYNYQRFNPDWLRQAVLDRKIYFANPKDFNDPWDCRPCYNDNVLSDQGYGDRLIERIDKSGRRWARPFNEADHNARVDRLRADPLALQDHIKRFSQGIEEEISRRYRVYCLSTKPECPLMWAHYADKHRGICLEFGPDPTVFDGTYKVVYRDAYLDFDAAEDALEKLEKGLLPLITKSADWSYEDEYRIIAQEQAYATSHHTLRTENNFFVLPSRMLRSIIIGCLSSQSDEDEIRRIIGAQSEYRIALKRAVRTPNRYALRVVPS